MAGNAGHGSIARKNGYFIMAVVIAMLAGLPVAVWMDANLSQSALKRQAQDMSSLIRR